LYAHISGKQINETYEYLLCCWSHLNA
jgi:hypothetical protein